MITFVFFVLIASFAICDPVADRVTSLPGWYGPLPSFRQWSGFLDAGNGKHLHYWFVEAQSSPSTAPLLLWLNGGPGCSSLDGFLEEHGPFHLTPDGKNVTLNNWAWNRLANMIYLESPVGVGFSYSESGDYQTNDTQVAADNLAALRSFYAKFPEFFGNDFYVTGESYGGVYVPSLAQAIVKDTQSPRINLKGIMVGNGLSSYRLNDNSLISFGIGHGLLGPDLTDTLVSSCCLTGQTPSQLTCNFHDPTEGTCVVAVSQATALMYNAGLNMYSLYANCTNTPSVRLHFALSNVMRNFGSAQKFAMAGMDEAVVRSLKKGEALGKNLGENVPCINSYAVDVWLNNPAVRRALNVPLSLPQWSICSGEVGDSYGRVWTDVSPCYQTLFASGVRALIYNGDTDMACNTIGDEAFARDLNRKILNDRQPWYDQGQVGGFVTEYEGLTFTSVLRSGHMVPQEYIGRPAQAFKLFDTWINKKKW